MNGMSLGMDLLPQQQMKASPTLIALNSMLVLSQAELQQLVQQELEENPALEQIEREEAICRQCKRPLRDGTCIYCLHETLKLAEAEQDDSGPFTSEEFDPLLTVAAPAPLWEALRRDLHIALPESEYAIVDYLIGSLNGQGFLDCSIEEIADVLNRDVADVERVLAKLREIGPTGIGARTVQESLLMQIEELERSGISNAHIATIVKDYWLDFGEHRYGAIARALGISYNDVVAVRDFMRQYLRPFPLDGANDEGSAARTAYLSPEVIIHEEGNHFVVEVVESWRYYLRLNPLYHELAQAISQGKQQVSSEESEHLTTYVARTTLFLTNLRQRQETIRRITTCLVERQEGFLRHGIRHLAPLTRAEVAACIGVHESTVSRATANKYVQLPNRSIVPFSHFFSASLSVKDIIHELVASEQTPLTDEEIVKALEERGISIARRTVAKYRAQLGILPSHLR